MIDSTGNNNKAMETTLNSQLTTHNSRSYSPPHITVVEFKVEHCFTSIIEESTVNKLGSRLFSRDEYYYSTGDTYTEYTSDDGQFSTGSWR